MSEESVRLSVTVLVGCALIELGIYARTRTWIGTPDISGPARVVDGDTIVIGQTHIRLAGIDAPELDQPCLSAGSGPGVRPWDCGRGAWEELATLTSQKTVTCHPDSIDKYRRTIAHCWITDAADGSRVDLGGWMVRQGWAVAYVRYGGEYLPQESVTRREGVGVWSGTFEQPWQWRQGHPK
jgi:endonuclease YncB( thermonuclease family)